MKLFWIKQIYLPMRQKRHGINYFYIFSHRWLSVLWMVDPVVNVWPVIVTHIDMIKTGYIYPEFSRIAAPTMVSINATSATEIMLGNLCMELIDCKHIRAPNNFHLIFRHGCIWSPTPTAEGTVTSTGIRKHRICRNSNVNRTTMACTDKPLPSIHNPYKTLPFP